MNHSWLSRVVAVFGARFSLCLGAFLATFLLPLAASAAPAVALTPNTLAIDSTSEVSIGVTGLTAGETVRIERYLDLNANGTIETTDRLVQSFLVTDGAASLIGGQPYRAKPGDEDGAANSQLTTHFSLPSSPELARVIGTHLIRISSPTSAFSAVTAPLTVTQTAEAQSLAGTVTDGTAPVPFAIVGVLAAAGEGDYVRGVVANASGQFSVNLPAGSYKLLPVAPGFVASFDSPAITLAAAQTSTGNTATLIPGPRTISGRLVDSEDEAVRLPGVQFFAQSQNGRIAIPSTAADGTFSIAVTADEWELQPSGESLNLLGYLKPRNAPTLDATTADVIGAEGSFDQATALFYGTVTSSLGAPLANVWIQVEDLQRNYGMEIFTDALGRFSVGVRPGNWHVQPDSMSPGLAGLIAPTGQGFFVVTGEATEVNFVATVPTAHLIGTVTNSGMPVANVVVGASLQNSESNLFLQATTNASGEFDLGVTGGTWQLQLENSSAKDNNLVSPSVPVTVADHATVTGIALAVRSATGVITGQVSDGSGNPLSELNVYAFGTISGVSYSAGARTDGSGHYTFPVIDGSWSVGVNGSSLNFQNQVVTASGPSTTANFLPIVPTAHFQGVVTKNGAPVVGAVIVATSPNGGSLSYEVSTNDSGQFDLAVSSGEWSVRLRESFLTSSNLVAENLPNRTIADRETISGLTIRVQDATGSIHGFIRNYAGQLTQGVFVSANATVGGVNYFATGQTNSDGLYSLPVIDGTWIVSPHSNTLRFNARNVAVSGSATANFNATVFNQQPSNLTLTVGASGSFTTSATAPTGSLTLRWQRSTDGGETWTDVPDAAPYAGVATPTLALTAVTLDLSGGRYRCVATGDFGTENSDAVTLTVNAAGVAPSFTQSPSDETVSLGESATFTVTATGTPAPTLLWQRSTDDGATWEPLTNDATHTGVTTDTLTVATTQATQSGDRYRAVATNSVSSVTSVAATLTLQPNLALWRATYFTPTELANPAVSGDTAIYGADGLTNLLKYALGLNPTVNATTNLPAAGTTATDWTYTYTRPGDRSDISYVVEVSTNLTSWTSEGVTHELVSTDAVAGTQTWRASYPLTGNPNVFFRLKVAPSTPPAG